MTLPPMTWRTDDPCPCYGTGLTATDDGQADELLADGVVHFNTADNCWVAAIDWSAIHHASEDHRAPADKAKHSSHDSQRGDRC